MRRSAMKSSSNGYYAIVLLAYLHARTHYVNDCFRAITKWAAIEIGNLCESAMRNKALDNKYAREYWTQPPTQICGSNWFSFFTSFQLELEMEVYCTAHNWLTEIKCRTCEILLRTKHKWEKRNCQLRFAAHIVSHFSASCNVWLPRENSLAKLVKTTTATQTQIRNYFRTFFNWIMGRIMLKTSSCLFTLLISISTAQPISYRDECAAMGKMHHLK